MGIVFGGTGVASGRPFVNQELAAGETFLIPSGTWRLDLGPNLSYQEFDQVTQTWQRPGGSQWGQPLYVDSDGVNFRIANQTGCLIGATVTSGGSGYTSVPTVTVNSGGATLVAILGPCVNTITVNNGGNNYTFPPTVTIQNPPNGGIPATAYAAISGGVVSTITVTDQGAGFSAGTPQINITPDPRDTTGTGAAATANMTASGQVVSVLVTNHGSTTNISTSGVLPTITISGGGGSSATAQAIMHWTVTGIASVTSGSGYPTNVVVTGFCQSSGSAQFTNPTTQSNLLRNAQCWVAVTTSGGQLTATTVVYAPGAYPGNPSAYVLAGVAGSGAVVGAAVFTVGGTNDLFKLYPV